MAEWNDISSLRRAERASGRACVLATLVRTDGSTYRKPGARVLFTREGHAAGLLSGGCLEGDLAEHARAVMANGIARLAVYDMRSPDDIVFGLGLGCEGRLEIWLERLEPGVRSVFEAQPDAPCDIHWTDEHGAPHLSTFAAPSAWNVAIVGANADAAPVCALFAFMGWRVSLFDRRPGVLEAFRAPAAIERRTFPSGGAVPEALAREADAVVLMNHHFETDAACLAAIASGLAHARLGATLRYIGLLGPARRRERILEIVPEARALFPSMLRAPAGLDVGADAPEAIALSLAAEIQAVLAGREPMPLHLKKGHIHDASDAG